MIIRKLAHSFYLQEDFTTLDGYIILACDGSKIDLPPTAEMREKFGGYLNQSITDVSMVKKPQANCSILIDVLNHIVLDAMVEPCLTSELPMLYKHLENCKEILHGKKVILLCDRYYGSAELFLYCMLHGYSFVTRAKTYMYKEQVKLIEQDGDIHVPFNKAWYRRMKRDDCRQYAESLGVLSLRVIKNHYEYTLSGRKKKQDPIAIDSIYMTNLTRELFPAKRIVELYHVQRWDNETAYFDIKNHLEAERFSSGKYNIVVNELFGKILCFTICGQIYEEADRKCVERRPEEGQKTRYDYIPNMKYIVDLVRVEYKLLKYLFCLWDYNESSIQYFDKLTDDCSRRLIPVRPGRHYKRWGRWMQWIPTAKFRLDGRRNPPIEKCYKTQGYMTTQ